MPRVNEKAALTAAFPNDLLNLPFYHSSFDSLYDFNIVIWHVNVVEGVKLSLKKSNPQNTIVQKAFFLFILKRQIICENKLGHKATTI